MVNHYVSTAWEWVLRFPFPLPFPHQAASLSQFPIEILEQPLLRLINFDSVVSKCHQWGRVLWFSLFFKLQFWDFFILGRLLEQKECGWEKEGRDQKKKWTWCSQETFFFQILKVLKCSASCIWEERSLELLSGCSLAVERCMDLCSGRTWLNLWLEPNQWSSVLSKAECSLHFSG